MTDPARQGLLFAFDGKIAYRPGGAPGLVGEPPAARERTTSVVAARRIHAAATTFRDQVHDALRAGAKTDEEICEATGLRGSTVRPRRLELLRDGLVEDSGHVRPTRSGRDAIVWRIRLEGAGEETGCRSS